MPKLAPAPKNPAGPTPLRRPGSIRRTSTISTAWPQGYGQPMLMTGQARDLLTPADGSAPRITATGEFEILANQRREILSVSVQPDHTEVSHLVGHRGGGNLRATLAETLPNEKAAATPLYLLLDDYSGASLVAGWVWSRWNPDWMITARASGAAATAGRGGKMEGICTGFAPGSSALNEDGTGNIETQSACPVPPLVNPADPLGWHEMVVQTGVGMRRSRRLDVWIEDGKIQIDVAFQDSGTSPDGGRVAVHEYLVTAVADLETRELLELTPDPRILPYPECPGAVANAQRIIGSRLDDLRLRVLDLLPGTLGCTHLNDVMRSLADVPALVATLRG